jgi:hypothetical protein
LGATVLLLAACAGGGATSSPGEAGTPASEPPASAASVGGGGGSGDAGALNACDYLTPDQIKTAVGWPVSAGVVQESDGQTDCEWAASSDAGSAVGLTIANYDDVIWQAGSSAGNSSPVSGIGDAAFKGWPTKPALDIKTKDYMVTIAVLDFASSDDKIDAEDLTLANLVLPQL